jgi:hypothetical protein
MARGDEYAFRCAFLIECAGKLSNLFNADVVPDGVSLRLQIDNV